ncbi:MULTISPECIES: hypothetical protein [Amycolatopsis]|uniref:Uncharacterized protein n=1 Tax=Amycolatopsis albidoflavus TaxID=102226 RepID=A0ABW5I7I7_9PSEU
MIGKNRSRKQAARMPSGSRFEGRKVGNALVVGPPGTSRPAVIEWANVLPADPDRQVVVLDLPFPSNPWTWTAVVEVLRDVGPVRLAGAGTGTGQTAVAGWLAAQLDVEVLAPDGGVRPLGDGTFVEGPAGAGRWRRFRPGQPAEPATVRFPVPVWEASLPEPADLAQALGKQWRVDQIAAGLWVRSTQARSDAHARSVHAMPYHAETLTIVVGSPGVPPVPASTVARVLTGLPDDVRARARVAPFGSQTESLGQLVANEAGQPVVCYGGLPVGGPAPGTRVVVAIDDDGQSAWRPFATQVGYLPGGSEPVVLERRAPFDNVSASGPAVHWLSTDIVVEVIPSGLWIRPPEAPPCASRIRAVELDPRWIKVAIGDPDRPAANELSVAAVELLDRLDGADRRQVRFMFPTAPASPGRIEPAPVSNVDLPRTGALSEDAPTNVLWRPGQQLPAPAELSLPPASVVAVESSVHEHSATKVPAPRHSSRGIQDVLEVALPPLPDEPELAAPLEPVDELVPEPIGYVGEVIDPQHQSTLEERDLLRRALGTEYDNFASAVVRLLSRQPGLRAVEGEALEAVVTDLVGVQVYLANGGARTSAALNAGPLSALRSYACCVMSGLRRLPSHRGPVLHVERVAADSGVGTVVTSDRFVNAVSSTNAGLPEGSECLVWSVTGRRVADVAPSDPSMAGRVVFSPGRSFKVLRNGGGRVLLREVLDQHEPAEITSRDKQILNRLERVAEARDEQSGAFALRLTAREHPWLIGGLDLCKQQAAGAFEAVG